jgi:HTH-type transcriptional regulator / antitoxin HigA
MEDRKPAEVFPPGEFIKDELEARGWTQSDLAEITGCSERLISEIITGKRSITPETAKALGEAFGTSPQLWLNLDAAYRLSKLGGGDGSVGKRSRLFSKAPIKEMVRRNWLKSSTDADVMERRVLDYYGISDLNETPVPFAFAARMSTPVDELTSSHIAWLIRARQLAQTIDAADFVQERLSSMLPEMRRFLCDPIDVRHVPEFLAEAGVRFLVVEPLLRTRIDGACFWLDAACPVVALSLRIDRIDCFWFTLMHELGHVTQQHVQALDEDLMGANADTMASRPEFEQQAHLFAAAMLVPQDELNIFIASVRPWFSKARIIEFANRVGVHPGLVVGQLQYRGEIPYSHSREMLVKVRQLVTESAHTDGWGGVLPTEVLAQ